MVRFKSLFIVVALFLGAPAAFAGIHPFFGDSSQGIYSGYAPGGPVNFGEFIATGGTAPYRFSFQTGCGHCSPPAGLSLTQTAPDRVRVSGTVTGAVGDAGHYTFYLMAVDATGKIVPDDSYPSSAGMFTFDIRFVPAEQSLTCTKAELELLLAEGKPSDQFGTTPNDKLVYLFAPSDTAISFTIQPTTSGTVYVEGFQPFAIVGTIQAGSQRSGTGVAKNERGSISPYASYTLMIRPLGAAGTVRVTVQCDGAQVLNTATSRSTGTVSATPVLSVGGRS